MRGKFLHAARAIMTVCFVTTGTFAGTDGSCCIGHDGPGCDDSACASIVCMFSPNCCTTQWDDVCAAIASHSCDGCVDSRRGAEGGIAGCDPCNPFGGCFDVLDCTCQIVTPCDPDCNPVCNPFCPSQFDPCACSGGVCNPACPQYNACICFGLPPCICDPCYPGCGGECVPGCPQWSLCACSPGPCNPDCPEYNECVCAGIVCGCPTAGLCCEPGNKPGCIDPFCCNAICAIDPSCCNVVWDQGCASAAIVQCELCNPCLTDPCSPECGSCVPGCPQWDLCECTPGPCNPNCPEFNECVCAGIVCGCPTSGLCCEPDDSPGCIDPICCDQICGFDPFCCGVVWDQICADEAIEHCFFCGSLCGDTGEPPCPCGQVLCCDSGLGQDPPGVGLCSACSSVTPSHACDFDGRGREGEPAWLVGGIEYLRTTYECDRGLGKHALTGQCVNIDRHKPDVVAFTQTWAWRALSLQRRLSSAMPFTQSQFIGSHNSYSTLVDDAFVYEHSYSISDQLDMGIRWLGFDVHWSDETWQNGPFPDLRLSHAKPDHLGMVPFDRPYRHGVEELATWIFSHPGEVVVLTIENRADARSDELLPPLEHHLGGVIFRPSHLDQLGGVWHAVSPNEVLSLGKRLVVLGGGDTASLLAEAPLQDVIHLDVPTGPSWSEDGNNGIKAFFDPAKGYMYDASTQTAGISSDRYIFSQFTGDPSVFSCDEFEDLCYAGCEAICFFFPNSDACRDCWAGCGSCDTPMFDGPGVFGITKPEDLGPMFEAGVNLIELCPVGVSNAGITGGQPPVEQPFQPLMTAAVWSWQTNHPPVNSSSKAAKAVLTGASSARFVAASPGETMPVAAQGATGACWNVSQATGTFASGTAIVTAEFPGASFAAPGSGLMMRRLADAMVSAGVQQVWVNYHDLDGDNNWLANVKGEKDAPPVGGYVELDDASDALQRNGFQGFPSTNITVAMWVKTAGPLNAGLFSYAVPGQSNELLIVNPANVTVFIKGGTNLQSGVSIDDGQWHHVAVTRSTTAPGAAGQTRIFIDGALVAQANLLGAQAFGNGGSVVLGHDQDCLGGCLDQDLIGIIDEVNIWHVARQPEEIIHAMGTPPDPSHEFLTAYWPFDDGSGTVAVDVAGGHNLTLSSPSLWGQYTLCGEIAGVVGDLTGDGLVGPADLGILLGAWGPCGGSACDADLDGNGEVGPADLAILLGSWT